MNHWPILGSDAVFGSSYQPRLEAENQCVMSFVE
jgi:hypothetical protein